MKTVRGLECNTEVPEAPVFFLRGNMEFNCVKKSRPEKQEEKTAFACDVLRSWIFNKSN